jgi:hypothetical protein
LPPVCLQIGHYSSSAWNRELQLASRRAARIASWLLRLTIPRKALLEQWPRLKALAPEPVRDEDDFIERTASQAIAFEVQFLVRHIAIRAFVSCTAPWKAGYRRQCASRMRPATGYSWMAIDRRAAQIFVAVLGASSSTYAQAAWTQGLAD